MSRWVSLDLRLNEIEDMSCETFRKLEHSAAVYTAHISFYWIDATRSTLKINRKAVAESAEKICAVHIEHIFSNRIDAIGSR